MDDLHAISLANKICNENGLDTIGTGATIAWTMDCFTHGVLSEAEIGFPAPFGDAKAMIRLLEMLVAREGIGDVLANGSRRAAALLGKGQELLITVKGAEAPAHMPQAKRSLGVIYAVNPFGADHQSSEHDGSIEEGAPRPGHGAAGAARLRPSACRTTRSGAEKVRYALKTQQFYSFLDTADLCQFVWGPAWSLFGPQEAVDAVKAVTGWTDFDIDELMEIGERRLVMLRAFNAREGIDRTDDRLPAKFFKPLTGTGPTQGRRARPGGDRGSPGRVLPACRLGRRHRQPDAGDDDAPGARLGLVARSGGGHIGARGAHRNSRRPRLHAPVSCADAGNTGRCRQYRRRQGTWTMRRITSGAVRRVLPLVLVAALAACSSGAATPAATTAPSAAATTAPSAAATTAPSAAASPAGSRDIILATTTSTQDSGLLDVLIPAFEQATGYNVKTVAVGSGAALKMGEEGNADVLMVHSPAAEKTLVEAGFGIDRQLLMHNMFLVVGTPADPAGITGMTKATDAFTKIADTKSTFVSRGDGSGTETKEKAIWKAAGITPEGDWYIQSGQGMGATLQITSEKKGYTLTDKATWLATKANLDLQAMVEGDPVLFNVYHMIQVNPDKWPKVNAAGAAAFSRVRPLPGGAEDHRRLRRGQVRRAALRPGCREGREHPVGVLISPTGCRPIRMRAA